jgi:serine protease
MIKPYIILKIFFAISVFQAIAQGPSGAPRKSVHVPGVVWVKVKEQFSGSLAGLAANARSRSNLPIKGIRPLDPSASKPKLRSARVKKAHVDMSLYHEVFFDINSPVDEVIKALYATGYFEVVEPSYQVELFHTPNDPQLSQQYYLDIINAYEAWDVTQGSESIVIAIVDSGGDLDHPDLQGKIFINTADPVDGLDNDDDGYIDNYRGWDFSGTNISQLNDPDFKGDNDPSTKVAGHFLGHGTKVAGCAAATPDNGIGVAGIGYKTKLLFTKHFSDDYPSNFSSDTYKGVLYAATHGAKIINCSWGGPVASVIHQDIIRHVVLDLGCLVVAAAGNFKSDVPIYPASYDYVLSVAGSNSADQKFPNSSWGKHVDITAPGFGIYTTVYDNTWATDNGTSLACPIVAGAASLVWAHNPTFTSLQVAEQVRATADDAFYSNNPAYAYLLGKGRLDVYKALTLQVPSIRAGNHVVLTDGGTDPLPGENAKLYLDFVNFLKPSTALTVTLSSLSPYITVNSPTLELGVINTFDTVRNTGNPFQIVIEPTFPVEQGANLLLTYDDGTYHDFQIITIELPSYIDINENNITTSLSSIGRIGYANPGAQTHGSGFIYDELQLLYEMGVIMGTSASDLYNNVRSTSTAYDQDFTPSALISKQTPGDRSSSEVYGAFRNAPVAGNESLQVSYRSLVWNKESGSPYNNFVLLEYTIRNTTASDVTDFHFGIFSDWDVSSGGGNDKASWHSDTKLGYVFAAQSTVLPYVGIQVVKGNANYFAIDNDPTAPANPFGLYDGFTDSEKFSSISSDFTKTQAGDAITGSDVSHVVSSGPHAIPANGEITIAFALHGGMSLSELTTSARYADSVYNFTLTAPKPEITDVEQCMGTNAVLIPEGASKFKLYTAFTGGEPVGEGAQFTIPNVTTDTTVYISNADFSYESVRTAVRIIVDEYPVASFTVSGDISSGKEVHFENESTGADRYEWNFGDGNTSTTVDADHTFSAPGNITVSLKAISNAGCEDVADQAFVIITGITESNNTVINAYPNPIQGKVLSVEIGLLKSDGYQVEVLNALGQPVEQFHSTSHRMAIDFDDRDAGVYFLRITTGTNTVIRKIIKTW